MVCNKQFIILGHCEIWIDFNSTSLRLLTILTLLVKYVVLFHADTHNKSIVQILIIIKALRFVHIMHTKKILIDALSPHRHSYQSQDKRASI